MPLWGRDRSDLYEIATRHGEAVGKLTQRIEELEKRLASAEASLRARRDEDRPSPLDEGLIRTIQQLSRQDPALYRWLERQARDLLAVGVSVPDVAKQLRLGAQQHGRAESDEVTTS